ncbi:GreA/GreB family elongation factor [Deinococcus pimensis]|uniref:GreA/GreB family elongation factor n=1 Tax=Deinococcus pimensis TaxID=309888 RepID=UPI000485111E|nr:GreA/GreB family elongation factor [Deinococcus pimensis]
MNDTTRLTREGYERLQRALNQERQRLDDARLTVQEQLEANEQESLGLDEAQREVMVIEDRITNLEDILARAVIIEDEGPADHVRLGAIVTLREQAAGREMRVQLVSPAEATAAIDGLPRISSESPVGAALPMRKVGESFTVELGRRTVTYEVLSISY